MGITPPAASVGTAQMPQTGHFERLLINHLYNRLEKGAENDAMQRAPTCGKRSRMACLLGNPSAGYFRKSSSVGKLRTRAVAFSVA
jgi:hypothetical protein